MNKFIKALGLSKDLAKLDAELFETALTHSSYSVDNRLGPLSNNERLEFYGDSVLRLACCKYLYNKFPNEREGTLTKYKSQLVSDVFLTKYSEKIKLADFVRVSDRPDLKSEKAFSTILACAFEAILGAMFIRSDFDTVYDFLEPFFEANIAYIEKNLKKINAKATLQEYLQKKYNSLPTYSITNVEDLQFEKIFTAEVRFDGELIGQGTGKNKKEAEQNAAGKALVHYGVINE